MTPSPNKQRTLLLGLALLMVFGMLGAILILKGSPVDGTERLLARFMRSEAATTNPMYAGIQPVPAAAIQKLFPAKAGKPLAVVFTSRFCLDCKHLKPILEKQWGQFPALQHVSFDIMDDRDANPAVFRAFRPVSVPTVILINRSGQIENVLYNAQTEAELQTAFRSVVKAAAPVTTPTAAR